MFDLLIRYEQGDLESQEQLIDLFQEIYDTKAYTWLQGHYGRVLHNLIEDGWIET